VTNVLTSPSQIDSICLTGPRRASAGTWNIWLGRDLLSWGNGWTAKTAALRRGSLSRGASIHDFLGPVQIHLRSPRLVSWDLESSPTEVPTTNGGPGTSRCFWPPFRSDSPLLRFNMTCPSSTAEKYPDLGSSIRSFFITTSHQGIRNSLISFELDDVPPGVFGVRAILHGPALDNLREGRYGTTRTERHGMLAGIEYRRLSQGRFLSL
jgi:hypothetical protein